LATSRPCFLEEHRHSQARSRRRLQYIDRMEWLVGYTPPPDTKLIDGALLALGKALYLCSKFEDKCRFVFWVVNAEELIEKRATVEDPIGSLEDLLTNLPPNKMLYGTIKDIITKAA
jgi:hypothetical protein